MSGEATTGHYKKQMKTIIIRQCSHWGADTKIFRAYSHDERPGSKDRPLGVSASTTGNAEFGARSCAAKAFIKYVEPKAERDEIETRIALKSIGQGLWIAELKS
jgi:hypothetical protein